jgi:NADH-quinone oxidoreductase subunit J
MNVFDTLFWVFSVAMVLSGLLVIVSRNPLSSALFLVLLFGLMAGLFVLLEAFFLAVIQVLVYAGAVMVLFLFVIMLLDIRAAARRRLRILALIGGVALAGVLIFELAIVLAEPGAFALPAAAPAPLGLKEVVKPLFARHMLAIQVTALLLLVSMVGVVLLAGRESE